MSSKPPNQAAAPESDLYDPQVVRETLTKFVGLCDKMIATNDSEKSREDSLELAKCVDVLGGQVRKRREAIALNNPAPMISMTKDEHAEFLDLYKALSTRVPHNAEIVSAFHDLQDERRASQ